MHTLTDLLIRLPYLGDGQEKIAKKMIDFAYRDNIRALCDVKRLPCSATKGNLTVRKDLLDYASERYPDLKIVPGAELICQSEEDAKIISKDPPTLGSSDILLIALDPKILPDALYRILMIIKESGHGILLSRADTIECFLHHPKFALRMAELGILFEVSAGSVLGENQLLRKGFCTSMLKNGAIFSIVTDSTEHLYHPPCLSRCFAYVKRHFGEDLAYRLFCYHPAAVLGIGT